MHVTVTVFQTAPHFCLMVLLSLFFRFRFLIFVLGDWPCYVIRSEVSVTLLSGHLSFLFRLTLFSVGLGFLFFMLADWSCYVIRSEVFVTLLSCHSHFYSG
jgi:hypothetical protein